MNKVIFKYKLRARQIQNVKMPVGAVIQSVQKQDGDIHVWALIDPTETTLEARYFEICGTGNEFDYSDKHKFLGTCQALDGVWHVYEYKIK